MLPAMTLETPPSLKDNEILEDLRKGALLIAQHTLESVLHRG